VISGAADPERASTAMESLYQYLVRRNDGLILLLTPPFDRTIRDPGYIKGYLPGIRENGGQYTHAAIWAIWAFAELGQGDRAAELFKLINPIYHADTPEKIARYRVEPYVIAADVYSASRHIGRGGWTWYTGSASWMYRLGMEKILGLQRTGNRLKIEPCIPHDWPGFEVNYRIGTTHYMISVENPNKLNQSTVHGQVLLDGILQTDGQISLVEDGQPHEIRVVMG
jgi:cyclic beta-1,2-glucan synthetase